MSKTQNLSDLRHDILSCRACSEIKMPNTKAVRVTESSLAPVPGSGNVNAKYMFIGEAPGEWEDEEGEGFRGRSGQYLRNVLIPMGGIKEEDCYFCNIIRCHPIDNRDPYKVEIKTCFPFLLREIELVNPDVIFTVGKIATETLLGVKISESHGNIYEWNGRLVMPLYHPAGVDRAVPRKVLEDDYKSIQAKLKQSTQDGEIRLPDYSRFKLVRGNRDLTEFLSKLSNISYPFISLDIETIETDKAIKSGNPDPITNQLAGLSVTFKDDIDGILSYYIPTAFHIPSLVKQDDTIVFYQDFDVGYTSWDDFITELLQELEPLISNFTVYIHNAKFEMESLQKYGFLIVNPYCTMIAGYTLREQSLGLKSIVKSNYGIQMTELEDLIDLKKQTVIETKLSEFWKYGCADTYYCFKYGEDSRKKIELQSQTKFFDIAHRLLPWVVQQETEGIYIDEDKREELRIHFNQRLQEVESEIYEMVGSEFNINSPEKVAEILFSKEYLGIDPPTEIKRMKSSDGELSDEEFIKFTDSGKHISTNKNDLKPISYRHKAIEKIVEHGSLSTIKSTFIDGIPGKQHWETGRLYPSINQTVTTTSRLSYSKWNGQNLPVRTEESKRIREMITVEDLDWWLWAIDQSQIELRYAAHISKDPWMIQVLSDSSRSIHKETCRMIYGIEEGSKDWDYYYKNSKNGNFARLYGAGVYKLAETLECPVDEAGFFLQEHQRLMGGFAQWVERQKLSCRSKGYVTTWAGFRRYIPEIQSKDRGLRSRGERLAINVPIQGGAQHHIQLAMGEIFAWFEEQGFESRMKLQIHDEIVGLSPIDEMVEVCEGVAKRLEFAKQISVPTPVDIEVGKNWGELIGWEEWKEQNL